MPPQGFRLRPPSFGGRLPPITFRLLVASGVTTLGCVVASHLGVPQIVDAFVLVPSEVIPGLKVWKILSYVFFVGYDPLSFLLDLLVLYFFGAWFERTWGPRRFLWFLLLSTAGSAAVAVAVGLFSRSVAAYPYFGVWPVMEALTVAMGTLEGDSQIYFYMLFPMKARLMMFLSWAILALYVIFAGSIVPFVAILGGVAMGLVLSLGAGGPRRLWLRFRAVQIERQLKRRARYLQVVPPPRDRDSGPKTYLH
ncbi:MAG: rhomboid family intramembrane serine protease [Myxococcales bacterium]